MTEPLKIHVFSSSHIIHLSLLCLIAFGACLTGNILPHMLSDDASEYSFVLPAHAKRVAAVMLVSQVANQEIGHQKAPAQVVLAASDTKDQGNGFGVAKQVGEHTWTMKVANDQAVGSAQEILQALNNYRRQHGVGELAWDGNLGGFAQGRADGFIKNGAMDAHAGFTDYLNNQDGFHKLGFMALGENSSFGYHLEAVHLIEWVYAGDAPHNNNQLNPQWSHVGIGVSGEATDLVFGGRKI